MVILFCDRKSKTEKEIIDILTFVGADYISDKKVCSGKGIFTIISEYKKTELNIEKGIAVFCDNTERFIGQTFPKGIIGICEDTNKNALKLFSQSKISVISCGMNGKNTVTLSSLGDKELLATLQRCVVNNFGEKIDPADFKIKLKNDYNSFSVMASVAIMLLKGILPREL